MYLKHKIFGMLFNIFTKFPVDGNLVSFITDSNDSFTNLNYIKNEFEKNGNFEFNFFHKDKFSINEFRKLAVSKYVFLDDNFFPLAFMKFKNESKVVQLWHAPGAFKKFGGSVEDKEMLKRISENTDYLIVTSKYIKDYYSEAFQIDKSKIKALGIPRCDYYFEKHDLNKLKKDFKEKYNISDDKKIILYAPTFREDEKYNNVFNYLDLKKFNEKLSKDYILILRLHPKIRKFYNNEISADEYYIDCTDYENEQELLEIADILITDYSSIMIEFSLLNKPIIFFAYDLNNYIANERGFYLDYKKDLPGSVAYNLNDLINIIVDGSDMSKISSFRKMQFGDINGNASKRIVDFILNGGA